ncbi:MAG: hypothetical protein DCF25_10200 [Leptolyngbya foveolarum]|uniref:Uncharacterized protein n=1 Tax=Leptolyngbya foveolarum TaxID=47253 RepID=A0A2W4UC40_9CYAN|nr:MAG: hypothetical protein DCF25_10200 [Leptolyngbya foveolarum]
MESNGTHSNGNGSGAAVADNIVAFPENDQTQLEDISTLLEGAPVMQQASPANMPKPASPIASTADFEQVAEQKPFSRRLGPKATGGAIIAGALMLPLSLIFLGGGGPKEAAPVAVVEEPTEGSTYVSPEDVAAMQAELEQRRSQQAFTDQQVDADTIDAAGRQQQRTQTQAAPKSTTTATKPAPAPTSQATEVSSRPAPAPRPTPAPSRVVTPAPRSTPPPAANPQPSRVIQAPAREVEPVDPFERRAQLQALGTYGTPPPTAQAARTVSAQASNPFETANPYIQAIAIESSQLEIASAPIERPLTEEELQYEQDANVVLAAGTPDVDSEVESVSPEPEIDNAPRADSAVLDLRRGFERSEEQAAAEVGTSPTENRAATTPMAIMPGTSTQAELPYGFSWQEGTPLPEILLMTTEDIMAGDQSAISAGTQFLGQAQIDPGSGAVNIQVVGIFGETQNIQIPRASVAVQAANGGVLTARANGGSVRSSGPNVGGFLFESLGNSLGNVLSNGDNVLMDVGGGLAETIIDGQVERSDASAAARNSQVASQPTIWTLDEQSVQLTFNNYIPLNSTSR